MAAYFIRMDAAISLLYFRVAIQSPISQNLRFYSMWRIRQITSYKSMLMNASIHRIFLMKLLGSVPNNFMQRYVYECKHSPHILDKVAWL